MATGKKILIMALGILIAGVLATQGCKNQSKTSDTEDSGKTDSPYFHGVLSLNGISFDLSTSGQGSMQKLRIQPGGLSIVNRELIHEIDGRIVDAEIEDLNSDGFPELLIYTQSAGSGSYGNVIAYSVNNGKSVSQVYFPLISDNPEASKGYMGHDEFTVIETSLAHRFPIYKEGDTNAEPTGGMRQIQYKMVEGRSIPKIRNCQNNRLRKQLSMERIAAFKIQKGLAKGFMVFGVIFLLLGLGLAIKSEEGWITIVYMIQGILFIFIGYTNIRNRKYYIEWDEKEIRSYLPHHKKLDTVEISDIKAVSIKLFEIELHLEDEVKILKLENLQFEELKKIKNKFEEIKSQSQA